MIEFLTANRSGHEAQTKVIFYSGVFDIFFFFFKLPHEHVFCEFCFSGPDPHLTQRTKHIMQVTALLPTPFNHTSFNSKHVKQMQEQPYAQ